MRYPFRIVVFLLVLLSGADCRADAPATEFFAIETAKLEPLASTDAALDSLSTTQLAKISIAHGVYYDGLAMRFETATFRVDAHFGGSADIHGGPKSITYRIDAGDDPKSWNLVSEAGVAVRQGKQFITEGWRKRRVAVILRFLDLKQ